MSARGFVDFGRNFKRKLDDLLQVTGGQSDFGEGLANARPKKPPAPPPKRTTGALRSSVSSGMRDPWPQPGNVQTIVIQGDEGVVKRSVVDQMHAVAEMLDFWRERGLWVEGLLPNLVKTQAYIEQLETEALELRAKRDLGDPIEDLT